MPRKNWGRALEFNRQVSSLTYLQRTEKVTENDIFLVLDTEVKDADGQPKKITLSGVQNSLNQTEVFTTAVSGIAETVVNTIGSGVTPYYGSFHDTTTQTNINGSGSHNMMLVNSTELSKGVAIVSGGLIQVAQSGVYNIQFSAQVVKTSVQQANIEIWLAKNGQNVEWSNTGLTLEKQSGKYITAWNWFTALDDNEHAEIRWYSQDPTLQLVSVSSQLNPSIPAIPSVILTVNRIG